MCGRMASLNSKGTPSREVLMPRRGRAFAGAPDKSALLPARKSLQTWKGPQTMSPGSWGKLFEFFRGQSNTPLTTFSQEGACCCLSFPSSLDHMASIGPVEWVTESPGAWGLLSPGVLMGEGGWWAQVLSNRRAHDGRDLRSTRWSRGEP